MFVRNICRDFPKTISRHFHWAYKDVDLKNPRYIITHIVLTASRSGKYRPPRHMEMSVSLDSVITVVLLGKTGFGKSATGNTLLGEIYFDETCLFDSVTKLLTFRSIKIDDHSTLNVYDTPGLMSADKDDLEVIKDSCEDMTRVMKVCQQVTVFLLVNNVATKVSSEDKKAFENAEKMFGSDRFWKHCILVLTKEDTVNVPNVEKCFKECLGLKPYLQKCENRVVAVCNKDIDNKREDSRKRLMEAIIALKRLRNAEYTFDNFQSCNLDRQRLILTYEISLKDNIYIKEINLIKKERMAVKKKTQRQALLQKIAELKARIQLKDNGTGVLKDYLDSLDLEVAATPDPWCVIA